MLLSSKYELFIHLLIKWFTFSGKWLDDLLGCPVCQSWQTLSVRPGQRRHDLCLQPSAMWCSQPEGNKEHSKYKYNREHISIQFTWMCVCFHCVYHQEFDSRNLYQSLKYIKKFWVNAMKVNTMKVNTMKINTMQINTMQINTIKVNTINQYNANQYKEINTNQYNTAPIALVFWVICMTLYWLPIQQCICYRAAALVWHCLIDMIAPVYLQELCRPVSTLVGSRALRSSSGELLASRVNTATMQLRAWSVVEFIPLRDSIATKG